jgi:dolichyl-phosphate beta-glucosyltransferase
VNDGSSDGTRAVIDGIRKRAAKAVLALNLTTNRGKAEAVRQGILYAASLNRFTLIGYWDADMSTPLSEMTGMLRVFDADPFCTLTMGARIRRLGSSIQRSPVRHVVGRVFATIASMLLNLPVYDSQCGAKILRADVVEVLFREPFLTKWVFDVEILARLRNWIGRDALLAAVTEVPLKEWTEVGGSKLRFRSLTSPPSGRPPRTSGTIRPCLPFRQFPISRNEHPVRRPGRDVATLLPHTAAHKCTKVRRLARR